MADIGNMPSQPNPYLGKGDSADAPRLWMRAVREGWQIPPTIRRAVIARAAQIIGDPTSTRREIARASQTLALLERLALEAAVHEDRMARLDAGTATDRVELLNTLTDAQLGAVAKAVKPDPPCPASPPKPKPKPKRKP